MIGLEKIIASKRKVCRSSRNEKFSYSYIAKLLGIQFNSVASKCKTGKFTVPEALAIFDTLITEENSKTIEFFKYLFTEQN